MQTTLDRLVAHQNAQNELTQKLIDAETQELRLQIQQLQSELAVRSALLEQAMPESPESHSAHWNCSKHADRCGCDEC